MRLAGNVPRDYETHVTTKGAVTEMVLSIREMDQVDEGNYTCSCINTLGTASRTIVVTAEPNPADRWTTIAAWNSAEEEIAETTEPSSPSAPPLDTQTESAEPESTNRSVSHSLILPAAPSTPPQLIPLKRNQSAHLAAADMLMAVLILCHRLASL